MLTTNDSYLDSNFASLLNATATAYDERNGSSHANHYQEQSHHRVEYNYHEVDSTLLQQNDGKNENRWNGSSSLSPGTQVSDTPINSEEKDKFDEIQRIIAAELSNLDHAQTLQSLQKSNSQDRTHQQQHPEDEDGEESSEGPKIKKRKTTRYKGVFKCGKKWKAQIQAHGVQHYLGLFETEEEAARAYDNHARMILGVMKAKTNFPYSPDDAPLQPIQPVATVGSPLKAPQLPRRGETEENDSSHGGPGKRSYVGMKLRKLSEQREYPKPTIPHSSSSLSYLHQLPQSLSSQNISMNNSLIAKATLGQSLVHLPMQLAQNSYVMNNIPPSYTPVMHPARYITNEGFKNLLSTQQNSSHHTQQQQQRDNSSIDWSKHPYTPLEITGAYDPSYSSLQQHVAEPDWRDQIYYWTGNLNYDDNLQCLTWKGRWLGSFTGKPSVEEFDSSNNEFFYASIMVDRIKVVLNYPSGPALQPISGLYKGYYMMDNGGGKGDMERYNDKEFLLEFEPASISPSSSKNGVNYNVFGKGDSEFGVFILNGKFNGQSKILEMCRQYVADTDLRSSMSLAQLKQYFKRINLQSNNIE